MHQPLLMILLLCMALVTTPALTFAEALPAETAPLTYQIDSQNSRVEFTATVNGAPVQGSFHALQGNITFSEANMQGNSANIHINTHEVNSSYEAVTNALIEKDWLASSLFHDAIFTSRKFTKQTQANYNVQGDLTLRDITKPLSIDFTIDSISDHAASAHGQVQLKRLDFGIGQGEWADTSVVKDEVSITFVVNATR
ncbi:MAG: YceI family protein [Rickettsiales bacterium]|nr:YceI family protein [Rickettsiales bacterium]